MPDLAITPFRVSVDDAALRDLHERLGRTRWPDELDAPAWSYGTSLAELKRVAEYWWNQFDWRAAEARINALTQFTAEIDGNRLHFIHERGRGPQPLPLLISHGWPGSFVEMLELVPMLADPVRFGGDAADAFDVIVPSIPGYGFSARPNRPGMTPRRIADLFAGLMAELGYGTYGVQGGDWGATLSTWIARDRPERVCGIHLNWLPGSLQPALGDRPLSPAEQAFRATMIEALGNGISTHTYIHSTRPQTLGYGLNDSPVGLASWLLDKFRMLADCDGELETAISLDAFLTNASVYWFSETITSSIRLYKEAKVEPMAFQAGERVLPPMGFASLPREVAVPPREWAERVYDVRHWTEIERGGHFAAMEQPAALADDIRAFFRPLRGTAA